ncbi:MAG: hypothetical protein K2Q26_04595 [Bdellovibrionales bacterium]|nr:hypothetical protein [Bdellovibrionales bacterium]
MIKFLLAPLFVSSFLISTQVQAETVVEKPKSAKKINSKKVKPVPQRVTVNFDSSPSAPLKNKTVAAAPASPVKKSKLRAEIKTLAKSDNRALAQKKYWSMRCKNGYIAGNKVFCSIEKRVTLAKTAKKTKAQRALASSASSINVQNR